MATPGIFDLTVYQGDTAEFTLNFTRTVDGVSSPVDFTGATGIAQIRRAARDPYLLGEFAVTFPDAAGGVVRMELPPDQANIGVQAAVYDLQITESSGRVRTWLKGKVTVEPGVSR